MKEVVENVLEGEFPLTSQLCMYPSWKLGGERNSECPRNREAAHHGTGTEYKQD